MTDMLEKLKQKLAEKSAVVGVVGLGYVGLPLSLRFSSCGFSVLGFDIDAEKAGQLNAGQSYV